MQKLVERIDRINTCFAKPLNVGKLVNKPGVYSRQHATFDSWSSISPSGKVW